MSRNIQSFFVRETKSFKNFSIPATHLGKLMRLILQENSFKFNDKHFLQTHVIATDTQMAVAFVVILVAHIKKQLRELAHKNLSSGRNLSMTFFQCGICPKKISALSLIPPIHSTPRSNWFTHEMSSEMFSFILKFSKVKQEDFHM